MTLQEAEVFFPLSTELPLEEIYAERLFEYKQFFLTKTPIWKTFNAKLKKLMAMDTAYHIITEQQPHDSVEYTREPITFSKIVSEAFHQWERVKGSLKQEIMIAESAVELQQKVLFYIETTDNYRQAWFCEHELDIEVTVLATEEDPMEILQQIKLFEAQGGRFFDDIPKLKNNLLLLKEMKRLSLLFANYGHGKRDI